MSSVVVFDAQNFSGYHSLKDIFYVEKVEIISVDSQYIARACISDRFKPLAGQTVSEQADNMYDAVHDLLNNALPYQFQNLLATAQGYEAKA